MLATAHSQEGAAQSSKDPVWIRPGVTNETFAGIDKPVLLKVWDEATRLPGDNFSTGDPFACRPGGALLCKAALFPANLTCVSVS